MIAKSAFSVTSSWLQAVIRPSCLFPGNSHAISSRFPRDIFREPSVPVAVYAASLSQNLLALALPLSIMQVYDRIIPNRSLETLAYLLLGLGLALVLEFILKITRSALLSWQATLFVQKIEHEAIVRILGAKDDQFQSEPASAHINRYAAVAAQGEYLCGQARLVAIDLPFICISLSVMSIVAGIMVLVPICLFIVFAGLAVSRARKFRAIINVRTDQDNRKFDFIAEALGGIHTLKGLAMEPKMLRRFERLQQSVAESTMASILTGQNSQTSALLYGSLSQLVLVAIGGTQVVDDKLSMGALACCTMLSGQILQPLLRAISLWTENETVSHRRAEIEKLMSLSPSIPNLAIGADVKGDIQIENVSFAYSSTSANVLEGVDLAIPAGSIIGVKGEDGSGRTTLFKLIRGDLEPTVGSIMIDGIRTTAPEFIPIRRRIVSVGAVPVAFRGTIIENLTTFTPDRKELAQKMTRLFGLESTIGQLPEGYDTRLGEGMSNNLPPSITQQISIVRAIVRNPRILILDGVNTVLDRAAERDLMRGIERLRGQLTVILISHRPSLLSICDHELIFSGGKVGWRASTSDRSSERAPA